MTRGAASRAAPAPRRLLLVLLALAPLGAGAQVTYLGAGTFTTGTANTSCPLPTSPAPAAGDLLLLVVESENQAITLATASGFVEVAGSPQSAGTAATNPGSRLAVFWKRAEGGDAAPVVADPGDHATCRIYSFGGVKATGDPWNVTAGGNDGGASDTSAVIPGATTTVAGTLVVAITSTSNNGTASTNCGTATNASLGELTERGDNTNTVGLGGGHCLWTGTYAGPGTYAATTSTLSVTTYKGALSIALEPAQATAYEDPVGEAVAPADALADTLTPAPSSGPLTIASVTTAESSAADFEVSVASIPAGAVVVALMAHDSDSATAPLGFSWWGLGFTLARHATYPGNAGASILTAVNTSGVAYTSDTLSFSHVSGPHRVAVVVLTGADAATLSNVNSGTIGFNAAISASQAGTTAGSYVFAAVGALGAPVAPGAGTTELYDSQPGWFARNTDPSAGGTVTLTGTQTQSNAVWTTIEILSAGGGSSGASYTDSASEAAAAGDALATTATWRSSPGEGVTLGEALAAGRAMAEARSEAAGLGEALVAQRVMSEARAEAVAPADGLSTSVAWAAAVGETAAALDALAASNSWSRAAVESLLAAAEATDQLNGGGTAYAEAVAETLVVLEAMGAVATLRPAVGEAAVPGDALGASRATAAVVSEVLVPLDGYAAAALRQAVVNEALAAGEAQAQAASYAAAVGEAVAAGDAQAAQSQLAATLVEAAAPLDQLASGTVDLTYAPRLLIRVRRPELAAVVARPVVASRATRPVAPARVTRPALAARIVRPTLAVRLSR